ncbi:MAG: hypothetical protein IH914_03970 [candidate division Zixibacteria bacterium]|nr:hypothetical protein [candidate division Zixibacteria bacterium]
MAAWEMFPDTFGLKGFNHPDSNRVFAEIMGSKPIRKKGLLQKVGEKMYTLTELGKSVGAGFNEDNTQTKLDASRQVVAQLKKIMSSVALKKYKAARESDITFSDVFAFLSIAPSSSAIELKGKEENLLGILRLVSSQLGSDGSSIVHGGTPILQQDIETIKSLFRDVQNEFKEELEIIRQRKHERKT